MRGFLGIPLPAALAEELADAARDVPSLKAIPPQSMHLTIRFLGDIADPTKVADALRPVAAAHQPFDMILKGMGAFPDTSQARVLWVGLDRGDLQAGALAKGVENALVGLGFQRERRPFRGHITLGRFKRPQFVSLPRTHSFGAVRAERLVLYQSILSEHGAVYSVLEEMSLGAGMTPGRD